MVKRIFVVSQSSVIDGTGGAITVFYEFCNMLAANGYEVTGMCYADAEGRPPKLNAEVKFVNLKHTETGFSYARSLNEYARQNRPDLFVFFFADLYAKADLAPEFDDVPRILMFHSRPDVYLRKSTIKALKSGYKNTIAQILFPSFKQLLPSFTQKGKVVCIPNGVNLPDNIVNQEDEKRKIIYLSRVDENKGLEFLIDSFALIAAKYPQWQIDVYGYVAPEYKDELEKRAAANQIDTQFHFCGITDKPMEKMLEYDFCVFPSYFEGFSLGLIEALSVGLPAIGLKGCTGVNEQIIDGVNGFLTDLDEKEYAQKIELLINDKALRRQMSANAVQSCKKYDKKRIWQMWLDLIKGIFNNSLSIDCLPETKSAYKVFSVKKIESVSRHYLLPSWFTVQHLAGKVNIYLFRKIKISIKRKGENK